MYWSRIQIKTWCIGLYFTSPYVQSRVDSTHLPWANPMLYSTLTLCQSRLYPPVGDFGFGLCIPGPSAAFIKHVRSCMYVVKYTCTSFLTSQMLFLPCISFFRLTYQLLYLTHIGFIPFPCISSSFQPSGAFPLSIINFSSRSLDAFPSMH